MKSVFVGKNATILNGKCSGITGLVVGADSKDHTVEIEIEKDTYVTTSYENISQEADNATTN